MQHRCCSPLHECARDGCELPIGRLGTTAELVPCRRCPRAYHQGCLPLALADENAFPRRAWLAPRNEKGAGAFCMSPRIQTRHC